jgi:hypothetical protein
MTPLEALRQHRRICDELYQLSLEERRFLEQHHRLPDAPLQERRRGLAEQLDGALSALRSVPPGSARQPEMKAALDQSRSRILQILQLEKENEQLILRYSLSPGAPSAGPSPAPGLLQKIYARHN